MSAKQLTANIMAVVPAAIAKVPRKWKNIQVRLSVSPMYVWFCLLCVLVSSICVLDKALRIQAQCESFTCQ